MKLKITNILSLALICLSIGSNILLLPASAQTPVSIKIPDKVVTSLGTLEFKDGGRVSEIELVK